MHFIKFNSINIFCFKEPVFWLCSMFAVGLVLRVVWVIFIQKEVEGDPLWYHNTAILMLEHKDYISWPFNEPTAWRMPGYTIILATTYSIFGKSALVGGLLNAVIGSITIFLVYRLAKFYMSSGLSLLCASVFCFWPSSIMIYTPNLYVECVYTAAITAVLIGTVFLYKSISIKSAVLFGLIIAISIYIRPVLALYPIIVFLIMISARIGYKKSVLYCTVCVIVIVLALSPWIIRNYIVFNAFIPFATHGTHNLTMDNTIRGIELYGFDPNADLPEGADTSYTMPDGRERKYQTHYYENQWQKIDFKAQAEYISNNFSTWIISKGHIPIDLWKLDINIRELYNLGLINHHKFSIAQRNVVMFTSNIPYYVVLAGAAVALFIILRRMNRMALMSPIMVLILILMYWNGFHLLFHGASRHHTPIMPVIIVLFGIFIDQMRDRNYYDVMDRIRRYFRSVRSVRSVK